MISPGSRRSADIPSLKTNIYLYSPEAMPPVEQTLRDLLTLNQQLGPVQPSRLPSEAAAVTVTAFVDTSPFANPWRMKESWRSLVPVRNHGALTEITTPKASLIP